MKVLFFYGIIVKCIFCCICWLFYFIFFDCLIEICMVLVVGVCIFYLFFYFELKRIFDLFKIEFKFFYEVNKIKKKFKILKKNKEYKVCKVYLIKLVYIFFLFNYKIFFKD